MGCMDMAISDYYSTLKKQGTTETLDGTGGVILSYVETEFQGLINQADSKTLELANKLNVICTHKLYCAVIEDLDYLDMIEDSEGNKYKITSKPKNTVDRNHHFKIMLELVVNNA